MVLHNNLCHMPHTVRNPRATPHHFELQCSIPWAIDIRRQKMLKKMLQTKRLERKFNLKKEPKYFWAHLLFGCWSAWTWYVTPADALGNKALGKCSQGAEQMCSSYPLSPNIPKSSKLACETARKPSIHNNYPSQCLFTYAWHNRFFHPWISTVSLLAMCSNCRQYLFGLFSTCVPQLCPNRVSELCPNWARNVPEWMLELCPNWCPNLN